ncbi:uncharacterized protein LOC131029222 isoform X1 [Cryptomeria japonica]|nr:uncharacterized protein LOC131029222 isoform X1 [Cryptomeria japonica]
MSAQEAADMEAESYRKDTRRKRAEDDTDESSKRHKHHHHKDKDKDKDKEKDKDKHRHHHRHHKHKHHHHKKQRGAETENNLADGMEKEQGFRFTRVSAHDDDEKEEGEIVEDEEEDGGKPVLSEIESGEIQPDEAASIFTGFESASLKGSSRLTHQMPESKDRCGEVENGFTVISEFSEKNVIESYSKSSNNSDVEMVLVEKRKDVHLKDRNGRSDNLVGKFDKYDGIKGEKYCKVDSKSDRFDRSKMTIMGDQRTNQVSREIQISEDGNGQFCRSQPPSEGTKASTIRDDRKLIAEQNDAIREDELKHLNRQPYSRHRKETLSESMDTNTQRGHAGSGDGGKVGDNETNHSKLRSIDDHNKEGYSASASTLEVTEKERYRRQRHSPSPSKDIEKDWNHKQDHLISHLKYTENERQIRQGDKSKFLSKDTQRDRQTKRGCSQSPLRDSDKERQWQQIGVDCKEVVKDLKYYTQPQSPGAKNDIEDDHRDHEYKERYHERRSSKSRDINKDKPLERDRSRSPEIAGDKQRGKGPSPSYDRYRDKGQPFSRDGYRDKGRSPSRDRYRDRVQSPSHDRYRERLPSLSRDSYRDRGRSISCDRNRDKGRSISRDRNRNRGRSISRDRIRDRGQSISRDRNRDRGRSISHDRNRERGYGAKRSRSREVRDQYSDLRERVWASEEVRKTSRSREREMKRSRSSRDRGQRDRRSNSREFSRAGRNDDRYDRYHRYGHERQSDKDKQRDRTMERERISKYQESTRDFKEEKERNREEENQEEYQERVLLQLAEQEEDDVEKIKEESRKRRQAILEKYRQQNQQTMINEEAGQGAGKDANRSTSDNFPETNTAATLISIRQSEQITGHADNGQDGSDIFVPDSTFSVGKDSPQNGIQPAEKTLGTGALGEGSPKSEVAADMFSDDIFGESPAKIRKPARGDGLTVDTSGLHDNWDDAEGYYSYRIGEVLDGRYEIIAAHGKGVFSSVVRTKDLKAGKGEPEEIAIKIIRNNDTMYKAGQEELIILKKLAGADPEDKRHCVRFLSSFKYRNHLCLVFESLHMNLREVLKKFGRNIGLKLTAVRAYAKQLFIALKHLKNCGVLHCDIKPDNMLVNEAKNVLKLCDFGNAMFAGKNEITPYLVSRFYRAPEIILGLPYDHAMDMWSVGCCLFELYLGKVLFPGPTNNDMLRLHMELKGPFPKKMLRKGSFTDQHFDQDLNFHATEEDPVSKKTVKRLLVNIKPKDIGSLVQSSPGEDPKMLSNFKDLLERIFILDPDKRLTVSQALSHPFITGK